MVSISIGYDFVLGKYLPMWQSKTFNIQEITDFFCFVLSRKLSPHISSFYKQKMIFHFAPRLWLLLARCENITEA
jgi:hypothetical protein